MQTTNNKRPYNKRRKVSSAVAVPPRTTPRGWPAGPEWKFKDTPVLTTINTVFGVSLLNGLRTGTSSSERIGQKVLMRTLELRLFMQAKPGSTTQWTRCMVVLDRQPNGIYPALTDVLVSQDVYAPRNLSFRKRFKILWDKVLILNQTTTGSPNSVFRKSFLNFKFPILVDYNQFITGAITDITSNSLLFLFFGQNPLGATDATMYMYGRMRYTDS